jgi:chorismate mutase
MSLIRDYLLRTTAQTSARVVAIRGAIDVRDDTVDDMAAAVGDLVRDIVSRNAITPHDIISAQFTVTPDLTTSFPAAAARMAGWNDVPMLCSTSIPVPSAMPRCVRILVHAYLPAPRKPVHVYLGAAASLRPDLSGASSGGSE